METRSIAMITSVAVLLASITVPKIRPSGIICFKAAIIVKGLQIITDFTVKRVNSTFKSTNEAEPGLVTTCKHQMSLRLLIYCRVNLLKNRLQQENTSQQHSRFLQWPVGWTADERRRADLSATQWAQEESDKNSLTAAGETNLIRRFEKRSLVAPGL